MSASVYLIDDDKAVRKALCLLLSTVDIHAVPFPGPTEFLAALDRLGPGCLIIDIRMPAISGLKLQGQLTAAGIDWPTVIISGHGDIEACRRAFRNGAVDFLSKPVDEQDLIDAIQKGQRVLDRQSRTKAERAESARMMSALTPREREVLSMIARELSTRDIALALDVSPRTVESHRASLGSKLGTTSPAEMTRAWIEVEGAP